LIQKSQVYVFRESSNIVEFENKFYLNLNFVFKFKAATENSKKAFFISLRAAQANFSPSASPGLFSYSFFPRYQSNPHRLPP
jgi:hypothetical protein